MRSSNKRVEHRKKKWNDEKEKEPFPSSHFFLMNRIKYHDNHRYCTGIKEGQYINYRPDENTRYPDEVYTGYPE